MHSRRKAPCCGWKRGENDALVDELGGGKEYCATCWQGWIERKRNEGSRNTSSSQAAKATSSAQEAVASPSKLSTQDETEQEEDNLDGVVHSDGNLYLVDKKKNAVYSCERSEEGVLISVGVLREGQIELFKTKDKGPQYPFQTDEADHCETPFEAYEDLAPFLSELANLMKKTKEELKIWDPYFCAGSVQKHFASLGFLSVHNVCEDFYEIVDSNQLPEYDCIVTNPPYSTTPRDHVADLMKFLTSQDKPYFVVQPNYVYTKPFWEELTSSSRNCPRPFFLTPSTPRKYVYRTPDGARNIKAKNLRTSPFVSMWYGWTGKVYTSRLYRWIASSPDACPNLSLACSEFFLPDTFKDSNDSSRRKKKKRRKMTGERDASGVVKVGERSQDGRKKKKKKHRT